MDTGSTLRKGLLLALGALSTIGIGPAVLASNHSDAPLIKQDPQANLTDVYAFIGTRYDNPSIKVLNVSMSFRPFSEPGDGALYERFADDARYSIHITDPVTGETKLRYDFSFSPVDAGYKNRNTILSYGLGTEVGPILTVGDARQNFTQTFRVTKVSGRQDDDASAPGCSCRRRTSARTSRRSTTTRTAWPSRARRTAGDLDVYTSSTIYDAEVAAKSSGRAPATTASSRDIPGIFDLLDVRILDNNGSLADGLGQDGNGVDGFKGFNVLTIAMQIPLSELDELGIPRKYDTVFFGQQTGVGVYASRQPSARHRCARATARA